MVDHRAVTGSALGGQLHPGEALLGGLDQVEPQLVVDGEAEPADLADRHSDALEQVRSVLDEPVRPEVAAGLLVGEEREHERPARSASGPQSVADDRQDHRVHVLHVDGAAPPHHRHAPVVVDLGGERRVRPVVGVRRDDVEVPVQQDRVGVRLLALHAGEDTRASWGCLDELGVETDLGEQSRDVLSGVALLRARVVAVVAGVELDESAAEVDDLAGRVTALLSGC